MLLLSISKSLVKKTLSKCGWQLVKLSESHDWDDTSAFIPLEATLEAARKAGLSVGDYIDTVMNRIPGATRKTLDAMARLGVFVKPPQIVVEIGPGSGRYLEKTLALCQPQRYEIYETSAPWAKYLCDHYNVVLLPTDGSSLKATPSASADLVQAHKVFSSIPSLPSCVYFAEMARVVRPGGYVVFDIITESGLDMDTFDKWVASGVENGAYPAFFPRSVAIAYFERQGFELLGTEIVPIGPGSTELFVFRRK